MEETKSPGFSEPIWVTRPRLPDLAAFAEALRPAWECGQVTNGGRLKRELEAKLAGCLEVGHCEVVANGTLALILMLEAFGLRGRKVAVPAFTFIGVIHALRWAGCEPVFCDLEAGTWQADPKEVELALEGGAEAILGVHLFGMSCRVAALEGLARRLGVPLLFDAAHGMGGRLNGVPLAALGDASILSFHATKPFTTLEGGAVVTGRQEIAERVRLLSDFGFDSEDHVLFPGMNAKMNEAEAAMGLVTLPRLAEEIADRGRVAGVYREGLAGCPGLTLASLPEGLESNHAYFPIRIEAGAFGMDRGQLMAVLRGHNVYSRAYFDTLGSDLPWYRDLASAQAEHLPESIRAARETLCLPMFADLPLEAAAKIAAIIRRA